MTRSDGVGRGASHLRKRAEWVTASCNRSEHVGSPDWLPVALYREGLTMAINIDNDLMTLEVNGKVISEAKRRAGGWWEVTYWPRFFDRHQAITALTVTELLEKGYSSDHPLVSALREELR
jgi:hypothetical protein